MVVGDIRAGMCGKLNVVLVILVMVTILAVDLMAGEAVGIVVVIGKDIGVVVVVAGSGSARTGLGGLVQIPVGIFAVESGLVGIDGGQVVACIDG